MFKSGRYGLGETKKASYEAHYLGWKPCPTMVYDDSARLLVEDIQRERLSEEGGDNIMHIQLSKKELKIVQYVTRKLARGGSKTEKYRFPPIPANDITFARTCTPPDVVATIILGYSVSSQKYLHVHAFRFNSRESAAAFEAHVMEMVNNPVNQRRLAQVREDLIEGGHLSPSSSLVPEPHNHHRSHSIDQGTVEAMSSLAEELRQKLRPNPEAPILLPPRDYDTISRSHGDAIRHRQAIMAEREALEANRPEEVDQVPHLSVEDLDDRSSSRCDSPASSGGRGNAQDYIRNRSGLVNRHSLGAADVPTSRQQARRNFLPFRASDSMPASSWQTHKQN